MEAVFLHPDEPELEFEGFLKKRSPKVRYFQGSLMCGEDLDRTQVEIRHNNMMYEYLHENMTG